MARLQLQVPTLSPTESLKESWTSLVNSNPHPVSLSPALQMARLQLQFPSLSPTESLKESWTCALSARDAPGGVRRLHGALFLTSGALLFVATSRGGRQVKSAPRPPPTPPRARTENPPPPPPTHKPIVFQIIEYVSQV